MAPGAAVRRMLGRHERRAADLYRGLYFDVDAFARSLRDAVPHAGTILEIGCGEGAMTARLAALYPEATILATDISSRLGRLYAGPADRVRFRRATAAELARDAAGAFDLVLIADVLHHVPDDLRGGILGDAAATLRPGGTLAIKEWERTATPIHWLCYASDRWLTGDRIRYMRHPELRALAGRALPAARIAPVRRTGPWRNNMTLLVENAAPAGASA